MTVKATKIIESGAYTKPEIIAEVVYVLQKVYFVQREALRKMIYDILDVVICNESDCVRYAMDIYAEISLDFVDCLLMAYNKINNEKIFSFDKKLLPHIFTVVAVFYFLLYFVVQNIYLIFIK